MIADRWAAVFVAAALGAAFVGSMDGAWVVGGVALAGAGTAWVGTRHVVRGIAAGTVAGVVLAGVAIDDAHQGWREVVGALATVAVVTGIGSHRRAGLSSRGVLAAVAISGAGVWACVPETDAAGRYALVVGVGAALGAALDLAIGIDLVGAAAGGLMFVALQGGQYRASAVVGAVGSFALLTVAWTAPYLPRRARPLVTGWRRDLVAVTGHALVAVVASRVAGRGQGLERPVLVGAGLAVVALGVVAILQQEGAERG